MAIKLEEAGIPFTVFEKSDEVGGTWRDNTLAPTVWANGCRSWYIGPDGVAVQWPFPRERLHELLRQPDLGDFEVRAPSQHG